MASQVPTKIWDLESEQIKFLDMHSAAKLHCEFNGTDRFCPTSMFLIKTHAEIEIGRRAVAYKYIYI